MTEGAFHSLSVPALPSLETSDWEALEAALAEAPALFLRQAWLPSPQEGFRPGIVRLGWQESTIIVAASLDDDRIFTRATADHQHLWELVFSAKGAPSCAHEPTPTVGWKSRPEGKLTLRSRK